MRTRILKITALCGLMVAGLTSKTFAQPFTENFDDITLLNGNGWYMQNNGTPAGVIPSWVQGDNVNTFPAYNGSANAYIAGSFNTVAGSNTVSLWLLTPNRTFRNGDVVSFYTRKMAPPAIDYPDRLQVLMSTNGASTNVGTGGAGVGDFTTMLTEINAAQTVGGYPYAWTQYTITISGLPAPTSGRIAFRYYVTNGGPSGTSSDYIGIDNVVYTPYVCPSFTMTAGGALSGATAGTSYSTTLTQTGALGAPNFAITSGALPPGLTLSASGLISGTPTATGTFNFTVTVNDASGCSGSQSYSITSVCQSNPISFSSAPVVCSNSGMYTLAEGLPTGGTYSGTGVSGGMFDPNVGTQTISYDYTDPYGCPYYSNYAITVNTAPTVTLDPIPAMCSNDGILSLTGESPAGGTFSGTGVTGSDFDPAASTQTIAYSYTDANGCSNVANQTITVNIAPVVSHDPITDICENAGVTAISGGAPSGGTYIGTGMTGADFDPSVGDQTITYTYTDGNGCSESTTATITVVPSETATMSAVPATCDNTGAITLSQGSPAGGVYSGTGVTGDQFDPTVGSQTVTYTIGGGTVCESSASILVTVNASPVVSLSLPVSQMCIYNTSLALTGGLPTGGTYSGSGVTSGNFNPSTAGIGSTTITYTFVDGNGCTNASIDAIVVDACASISESESMIIQVSPNPSNGHFVLTGSDLTSLSNVTIVDVNGKSVSALIQMNSSTEMSIALNDASNGIYIVRALLNNKLVQLRLMKQ